MYCFYKTEVRFYFCSSHSSYLVPFVLFLPHISWLLYFAGTFFLPCPWLFDITFLLKVNENDGSISLQYTRDFESMNGKYSSVEMQMVPMDANLLSSMEKSLLPNCASRTTFWVVLDEEETAVFMDVDISKDHSQFGLRFRVSNSDGLTCAPGSLNEINEWFHLRTDLSTRIIPVSRDQLVLWNIIRPLVNGGQNFQSMLSLVSRNSNEVTCDNQVLNGSVPVVLDLSEEDETKLRFKEIEQAQIPFLLGVEKKDISTLTVRLISIVHIGVALLIILIFFPFFSNVQT